MFNKKTKVALIYDFDGTLSPGNMQEYGFIQALGKSPQEFWEASNSISEEREMNSVLAYMKIMIDGARKAGISLKRESFVEFGRNIELFPGVKEWFGMVNEYGESQGVVVEHYINSSGLTEMIEGSEIAHEFKKIFACSFYYDKSGKAVWPAVAVDFTAKTQFLFKITKGIMDIADNRRVNESIPDEDKPVPFSNMIYFGDGQTDVPCMKIVKMFGGNAIAVYSSEKKRAEAAQLLREDRVNFICPTDYREGGRMFDIVCSIIDKVKAESEYNKLKLKNMMVNFQ
ncbi:MAG: haloacid dehalogenase-like hydrolase [Bacteroidales bacterium]|nr:haloacid dehalogenase-like hydrolase [Candidatus Equibacterium intestinale]